MDISCDSDSDTAIDDTVIDDTGVSQSEAKKNYEEAGILMPDEKDTISLDNHADMICPSCEAVLAKVVEDLSLPYDLSDFQKLSINILLQSKDLILLSPTGTGKVCTFIFSHVNCIKLSGNQLEILPKSNRIHFSNNYSTIKQTDYEGHVFSVANCSKFYTINLSREYYNSNICPLSPY